MAVVGEEPPSTSARHEVLHRVKFPLPVVAGGTRLVCPRSREFSLRLFNIEIGFAIRHRPRA
jgi:hypothetical protein